MSISPPAATDSSSTFLQPSGVSTLMPIKLTKQNYFLWKSLFISVLRPSDMLDLAEGREQCPPQSQTLAHTNWIKKDQTLLTWINSNLSETLLGNTAEFTSGRALWLHLEKLLAENARTHVRQLRNRLRNLDMTESRYKSSLKEYLKTAKEIADGLEAAGSPVDDSEFVSCVLNGLPRSYEGFAASIIMDRPEPLTREQLQESLILYEPKAERFIMLAFEFFALTLCALFLYDSGVISFIFPLVLFSCVVVPALIWHMVLSSSKIRKRAPGACMKLHTE